MIVDIISFREIEKLSDPINSLEPKPLRQSSICQSRHILLSIFFFFTILKLRTLSLISHISVHPEHPAFPLSRSPHSITRMSPTHQQVHSWLWVKTACFMGKHFFFVFYFCWCLVLSVLLPRLIFISCDFMFLGDLCYQWQMIIFSK